MERLRECPSCRALLTPDQRSAAPVCPYCGRPIDAIIDAENPYAPPRSTIRHEDGPTEIPRDFGGKLLMAASLFFGQLPLFASLVLTVWFPGNLVIQHIEASNPNRTPENALAIIQLKHLVELVFGPIYVAGIVTALADRMMGARIGYVEAMRAGIHHWGRLFGARFIAGLMIGIGFIAFIIPGIILAIRYSLIDMVVVVEGEGPRNSRLRSTFLSRGRNLPILLCGIIYLLAVFLLSVVVGLALEASGAAEDPLVSAAVLCAIDVFHVFATCLLFLIYWEARQDEYDDRMAGVSSPPGVADE